MKKIPFITDILATGLYLGKIPIMPGTFGSLLAIPLGYLATFLSMPLKIAMFVAMFIVGIFVSKQFAELSGNEDPSCVVIDEYVALFLLYIIFPFKPFYIILGFIAFRVFDIVKIFPIKNLENLPHGVGIMMDDIMAVIYAGITCYIIKTIIELI